MTLNTEISISDIIASISLFLVVIGGIFAFFQWRKNLLLKRADYINELTEKIRTDVDIKDTIYIFDYSEPWYDQNFHSSKELEIKVDKTLSYFSYICYLKANRIISEKEFGFFKYEIKRILINPYVQDYFYNLYHFANRNNVPITFDYLFKYGRKSVFDATFFDKFAYKTSSIYHRYLNF